MILSWFIADSIVQHISEKLNARSQLFMLSLRIFFCVLGNKNSESSKYRHVFALEDKKSS